MPRRESRGWMVWGLAAAVAVMLVWRFGEAPFGSPSWAQTGAGTGSVAPRLVVSHAFYGSTPSLAWSPDGTRLAFNAAYEYFGHETELSAHRADLGLWVYERDTAAARRLVAEQRYHPAWLGDAQIASGCSPYESCSEGLYVSDLAGAERRVEVGGAYHTGASDDGRAVFYNGFPGYTGWNRIDVDTLAREGVGEASCSWEPPPGLAVDQCVQQVGDVAVDVDAATGLWARFGEGPPVLVDSTPAFVYSGTGWWGCAHDHGGPVDPCLSSDGRQVAYVAQGPGSLLLRVHELPTPAEAALMPSSTGAIAPPGLFESDEQVLHAGTVDVTPQPLAVATTPAVSGEPSRSYWAVELYGDTASLAWSPDGRRLAFNAAFLGSAYRGEWDPFYTAVEANLGLFVADVQSATVQRITADERYHPAWTDDATVASGCSSAEACEAGVALTDLTGASRTVAYGEFAAVAAATSGGVLYHDTYAATWSRYDLASGAVEAAVSAACPYEPPPALVQDQCLQQVGDVRVWVQAGLGLFLQIGTAPAVRLDPTPPWLFQGGYGWGCSRDDFSGPVEACLSPDGQHVAYVARGSVGAALHVHAIPR